MKRITIWAIVGVVVALTGFIIVRAEAGGRNGWCGRGCHHAGPLGFLIHDLKLSDAQRAQINALWQVERPILSTQIRELLAENKAMSAMSLQESPDQSKVEEMAQREATTIAALLMEKERLQAKIYGTVLNPEQRSKAVELQRRWESHLDHAVDHLDRQPAK